MTRKASEGLDDTWVPAKPKDLSNQEMLVIRNTRSIFERRGRMLRCHCGGLMVSLLPGEEVPEFHSQIVREEGVTGVCLEGLKREADRKQRLSESGTSAGNPDHPGG